MQRNKVWLVLMVFGIMLITTVCYLTLRENSHKQYANGEIVQIINPSDPDYAWVKMKWK